jgi:RNA polymerase sigma-70 factor (ECF subfamily)
MPEKLSSRTSTSAHRQFSESASGAIAELFRKHNRLLIRFLAVRLGSYQEANDVAQEAYARLLELERPNAIGFLRAYLFKIAGNLAIDRIRARAVVRRADTLELFEQEGDADCLEREIDAAQEARRFWDSLQELPRHYRQAVVLNRIRDLSCEQIARQMGRTDRTVRRYIAAAITYCQLRMHGSMPEEARKRSCAE